jgi:hypothetical protein
MRFANKFHRDFPLDLAAATDYYDQISDRLGSRFRERVRQSLLTIGNHPELFGYATERLRGAMVRNFPYVILYRFDGQTIFFAGLFHAASDPARWSGRDVEF